MGGVDAVCAAGKAEGQVNIIATPPDWANYGQIIADFSAKYGIKVQSDKPDGNSQDEINAATQLAGTGASPTSSTSVVVAAANTALFAPYQVGDLGRHPGQQGVDRPLVQRLCRLRVDRLRRPSSARSRRSPTCRTEVQGQDRAQRRPLKASAGFNGVVMAALANGGSADDIAPGVNFFKDLADAGNLIPVDPTPATIAAGQTPSVIDWTYNNAGLTADLKRQGHRLEGRRPDPTRRPSPPSTTTRSTRTPPSGGRPLLDGVRPLDARQNAWLKGFALPVRLAAMQTAGTVDQAALAAVNPPTTPPVQLTQAQTDAATKYLTDNWKFITIK